MAGRPSFKSRLRIASGLALFGFEALNWVAIPWQLLGLIERLSERSLTARVSGFLDGWEHRESGNWLAPLFAG